MLSNDVLGELVRMLQSHTPLVRLTHMEARTVLELLQQRGWKITPPAGGKANV